jgi:tetratricopeptide (TPR) repeat protein
MKIAEKILKGISLKEQGNDCFAKSEYMNALRFYHQAICYLKGLDSGELSSFAVEKISDQERPVVKLELQKIKSNMSAVYLKLHKYQKVLDVLSEIDNSDVKGLYRRGQAYKGLNMFDKAFADLKKAAILQPTDKNIRNTLEEVKEELRLKEAISNQELKDKLGGNL